MLFFSLVVVKHHCPAFLWHGCFYKKGGVPSWDGGPLHEYTFPGLILASACCANRKLHCYPGIMRIAILRYERNAMCSNAHVTLVHARWAPWHPNFFFDAIVRVCPRPRKPLITAKENHTSQPPIAIMLNVATVITNRLSPTIIPGPAGESQQQAGSGEGNVFLRVS